MKNGLLNTAPHVLIERFHHQNPAISVLIVNSQCLCTSQKEELPVVCGTGAEPIDSCGQKHKTCNGECSQTQNLKAGSSESSLAPPCSD